MKGEVSPVLINVLNFFDGVLTLYAMELGVEEANPLMAWLLGFGPIVFISVKCGTVALCLLLLQRVLAGNTRKHIFTVLLLAYITTAAWHLYGALLVVSAGGVGP